MRLAGLVLAGGRSSRFGSEKAAAQLDGRPLLAHAHAALAPRCEAVAVSAQPGSQAEAIAQGLGLTVLADKPGHPRGPLAGVVAGLAWAEAQGAELLALSPCDTPRMGADALARLIAALGPEDEIAAAAAGDRLHTLCAVARVAAMRPLAAMLDRGEHPPMQALWRSMRLVEVRFEDAARFTNVNRPQDLAGLGEHPLDRPVWNGLATRHAGFAQGSPLACRYRPGYGVFAAARDASPESAAAIADLVHAAEEGLHLIEPAPMIPPPGTRLARLVPLEQMIAPALTPGTVGFDPVELTEADAPEMLALATLTQPGPFFAHTNRLGRFVGVKAEGRLVAMAGERMAPPGFAEVSGVCAHPDHRGRGYAAGLMRTVAEGILARGEIPFLHVLPDNAAALALDEALGFVFRRAMTATVLVPT